MMSKKIIEYVTAGTLAVLTAGGLFSTPVPTKKEGGDEPINGPESTAKKEAETANTQTNPLDELVRRAARNSPALRARKRQWLAARRELDSQSTLAENPVLQTSYQNIPAGSWPAFGNHPMSGVQISISQKLAAPWEVHYREKFYQNQANSLEQKLEEARLALERDIRLAFYEMAFGQKKLELLRASLAAMSQIVKIARIRVSVNKMNSSQLLKIEADRMAFKNQLLTARAEISDQAGRLRALAGKSLLPHFKKLARDWKLATRPFSVPPAASPGNHPLARSLAQAVRREESALSRRKAGLFPGVTLSGGYTIREKIPGGDNGEDFISLRASVPIPLFYTFKDRHEIGAAREKARALREELRQLIRELRAARDAEKNKTSLFAEALKRLTGEVVPRYQASYKAQLRSLATGSVEILDVLDSYRRFLDASLESARTRTRLCQSRARLAYLTAAPVEQEPTGTKENSQ